MADASSFEGEFTKAGKDAGLFSEEFKAAANSVVADSDRIGAAIERGLATGSLSRGQASNLIGQRLAFYGASADQAGLSEAQAAQAAQGVAAQEAGARAAQGAMGVGSGLLLALSSITLVAGAIGGLVTTILQSVDAYAAQSSEILRNSQAIGMNAQELQVWDQIAKVVDIDQQSMVLDFERFAKNLEEGAPALKATGVDLKDLGITTTDVGTAVLQLADYFHTHNDEAQKAAIAQALFGRSGSELIPILNQGSAAFKAYEAQLEKAGILLSNSDLFAGAEAQVAIQHFSDAFEMAKDRLIVAALPGFTVFFQEITTLLENNKQVWTDIGNAISGVVSFILGVISGITGVAVNLAGPAQDASAAYQGLGGSAQDAAGGINGTAAATKAATDAIDNQIRALQAQKQAQDDVWDAQKQALNDQLDNLRDVNDTRRRQGEDLVSYERRLEELGLQDKIKAIDDAKSTYDRNTQAHIDALNREKAAVQQASQAMAGSLSAGMNQGTSAMISNVESASAKISQKFVALGQTVGKDIDEFFKDPKHAMQDAANQLGQLLGSALITGMENQLGNQIKSAATNGTLASALMSLLQWGDLPFAAAQTVSGLIAGAVGGHAEGTISTSEHIALISEGNQAEAVIPLSKPARAMALMEQSGLAAMARGERDGNGGGSVTNIAFNGPVADELVAGRVVRQIDKQRRQRSFTAARGFGTS